MNEEPDQITIGETTTWTKTDSAHPAPDYTLKYTLNSASGTKTITGAPSDTDHIVTIPAAGAASLVDLTAGVYTLLGWFEKGTGDNVERYTFVKKTITLLPNLFAGSVVDQTSNARQTLALVQAAIKAFAKRPVDSITVNGKMFTRPTFDVLCRFEREYVRRVADEIAVEKRAQGKSSGRIIKSEFTTPI